MEMKYVLRLNHNKCLLISYEVHTISFSCYICFCFFSLLQFDAWRWYNEVLSDNVILNPKSLCAEHGNNIEQSIAHRKEQDEELEKNNNYLLIQYRQNIM